jgi:1,2-phenylacetyl-CoA epoxidase PaaB subunit
MNRINCLVATVLCGVLLSCQQEKTPRTVATEFVQQLYGLDFAAAGTLAAPGAQDVLQHARQDLGRRVSIDDERGRRSATTADATFETAAFIERTNGSEATVQNNQLSIQVKKEGDEWKVVPTPELVDALVNHPLYLDEAKSAWANLQQEYEKRNNLAREYSSMRASRGERSEPLVALDAAVRESMGGKVGTAAERADFLARQEKLEAIIEKGVEPAMNASADFSLNYIVQLSDVRKRIQEARKAYADAARKARDKDYPLLP